MPSCAILASSALSLPLKVARPNVPNKTDLEEFYPTVDLKAAGLENLLSEWQHYCNWFRPCGSLGGKNPDECRLELSQVTPFWDEVERNYHPEKEWLQVQN